jgi:uncharacterized protein (TIGR02118 family)
MIKTVVQFKRKQGMSVEEFRNYRQNKHLPLVLSIPEAKKMSRFVVSHPADPSTSPEPSFDAMLEIWFDTLDDMNALFQSENFLTKVDPDHANFVDPTTVKFVVTEELVVIA